MNTRIDPVCGMAVSPATAAASSITKARPITSAIRIACANSAPPLKSI